MQIQKVDLKEQRHDNVWCWQEPTAAGDHPPVPPRRQVPAPPQQVQVVDTHRHQGADYLQYLQYLHHLELLMSTLFFLSYPIIISTTA